MISKLKIIFYTFVIFTPFIIGAVEVPQLVPICNITDPSNMGACGFCDVISLINNIINFIIYVLAIPAATLLFSYAGWLYLSDAGTGKNLNVAKSIFVDVAIGFVLVLAAWLIISTILATLAQESVGNVLRNNIDCVARRAPTAPTPYVDESSEVGSTVSAPGTGGSSGGSVYTTDQAAREALAAYGITNITSTDNCTNPAISTCTGLVGLRESTVSGIGNLAQGCARTVAGCNVTISGGTEEGHVGETAPGTHGGGDKMDIRLTNIPFNNFMNNTVLSGATPTQIDVGSKYSNVNYNGRTYNIIREGNHWDVQVVR